MTVLPDERAASSGATVARASPTRVGVPLNINIGTLDTIGGTTYDWFTNGPVLRMIVDSRHGGIHAVWMHSFSTTGTDFPDRCMRYNFYNTDSGAWNWNDPDFMLSGVNVFPIRTGYGSVDADANGAAVISAHHSFWAGGFKPIVAVDYAVGAGIFDYSDSTGVPACQWPSMSVGQCGATGAIHIFPMTTDYELMYSHIAGDSWSEWLTGFDPNPGFPTQNIVASKLSNKACATWVVIPSSGQGRDSGYLRESPDGGETWYNPVQLEFPPAFSPGSETLPSFHISSLFPFYDKDDRLSIVASVHPYVNDTNRVTPSEIWHYCPDNFPKWNRIHRASCAPGNMQGSVGYNAAYACRPSVGQDEYGDLFVAWEQFDSANVETTTTCLRADIWAAGSTDGGVSWSTSLKLTTPGTVSCRYPSICDRLWPGDSLAVLYLEDLCAGSIIMGQGPATDNPVVVQKVPIDSIVERGPYSGRLKRPNGGESLFTGDTFAITWVVTPRNFDHGVLSLSTDGGSTFPTVLKASIPPGDTLLLWDSVPQVCCSLCRVKFSAVDSLGDTVFSDASYRNFTIDTVFVGVSEERPEPFADVRLFRPAPNPFARATSVRLVLPRQMSVAADVYNAVGQKVRSLASGLRRAGVHNLVWDGTDSRGRRVHAGVYYLRTTTESGTVTEAIILSR